MQYSLRGLLVAVGVFAVFSALLRPFLGLFPPFYYAEFRAVQERLSQIPDLEFVNSWKHEDLALEGCGFVVTVKSCPRVRVDFHDYQDFWGSLFDDIDGIIFLDGSGRRSWVSRKRLRDAGLPVNGLADVLVHLNEVLAVYESGAHASREHRFERCRSAQIRYPLDNY